MYNKSKVSLGFVLVVVSGFSSFLFAEMKQNSATKKVYSIPASQSIDQEKYNKLANACWWLSDQVIAHHKLKGTRQGLVKQDIADRTTFFLLKIGTPTALRLLADLGELAAKYRRSNGAL